MFDYESFYKPITKGMKEYTGVIVTPANSNEKKPSYDYIAYTVLSMSENKGTYGVYPDGKDRKPFKLTISFTALSDKDINSKMLAVKAREWLDHVGTTYLNDNGIYVQSVEAITNRDNILTVDYEYRNGFDCVFEVFNEVDNTIDESGVIETVDLGGEGIERPPTVEEQLAQAQKELDEANYLVNKQQNALSRINVRLKGGDSND